MIGSGIQYPRGYLALSILGDMQRFMLIEQERNIWKLVVLVNRDTYDGLSILPSMCGGVAPSGRCHLAEHVGFWRIRLDDTSYTRSKLVVG